MNQFCIELTNLWIISTTVWDEAAYARIDDTALVPAAIYVANANPLPLYITFTMIPTSHSYPHGLNVDTN